MFELIPCPNMGTKFWCLRDSNIPTDYFDSNMEPLAGLVRDGDGEPQKFVTERDAKEYMEANK